MAIKQYNTIGQQHSTIKSATGQQQQIQKQVEMPHETIIWRHLR